MLLWITIILGIIADQAAKFAALGLRDLPQMSIPLWPGVLSLTYVENRGAAFGILQHQQWLLIALTLLVVFGIIFFLNRRRDLSVFYRLMVALLLSGALGNLIDRVRLGYVIDFFEFKFIHFAVFNVADVLVTLSVLGLCFYYVFLYDQKRSPEDKKRVNPSDGVSGLPDDRKNP